MARQLLQRLVGVPMSATVLLVVLGCALAACSSAPVSAVDGATPELATTEAEAAAEFTPAESTTTTTEPTTTTVAESTTTTVEPTTTTTEPTTGDPELDALIDELMVFVEAERGLRFTNRPDVALLDADEFSAAWTQLVTDDARENADDYETFTNIYQALGIISADLTLEDLWLAFGEAGVLGYYQSDTEQIRLRAGEVNALTRTTLVHELVHALEDQNFDIDRDSYGERDDEISWAFSSLIEGSARVIENRYRAAFSAAELEEEQAAIRALPRSVSLSDFTTSFLELQFGRYNYGETFAAALWAEGQPALDAALMAPPTSSELVLEPSSFIAGITADSPIAPPPAEGIVIADGVWGEAAWIALLADVYGVSEARGLADGWGGDWYVAWDDGDATCVRIDVRADNADELAEYASALGSWVTARAGRDLTLPDPDVVRITSCG